MCISKKESARESVASIRKGGRQQGGERESESTRERVSERACAPLDSASESVDGDSDSDRERVPWIRIISLTRACIGSRFFTHGWVGSRHAGQVRSLVFLLVHILPTAFLLKYLNLLQ